MKKLSVEQTEYAALLRRDFSGFIERSFLQLHPGTPYHPNWHIDSIASHLEECRTGETRRLILCVPPRSLKSHCASVTFPAWLLAHNPASRIICASYAQHLASTLASDTRRLMMSRFYRETFATRISRSQNATDYFATSTGGFRFATSVGGPLTGQGADFIIIDDPIKADDALSETLRNGVNDWFRNTVLSRLNDKIRGCIILVMQRFHEDDLVGCLEQKGGWKVLRLPAIAEEEERHIYRVAGGGIREFVRNAGEALHPDREPLALLEEMRSNMGSYNFAAQYQQNPVPFQGNIIRGDWFQRVPRADFPKKFELIFQSWDTANKVSGKTDFSVCTTWGVHQTRLYLLHVVRQRLEYPDLKRLVVNHANFWDVKTVVIEDKASGTQLLQDLKREAFPKSRPYSSALEKAIRFSTSAAAAIENGMIYLPDEASWLDDYLHELTAFPSGKYDDQVDSTSQAIDWYLSQQRKFTMGLSQYQEQERLRYEKDPTSHPDYQAMFLRPRGGPSRW